MQQMIDYLFACASFYAKLVTRWNLTDAYLFNIPLAEYLYRRVFCPRVHLRLGDLPDDRTVTKMIGFSIAQLLTLYRHFALRDFINAHQDTDLQISTNSSTLI